MLLEHFRCGLVVSMMQPERSGPEIEIIVTPTLNPWCVVSCITLPMWISSFLTVEILETCSVRLSILTVKLHAKQFVFQEEIDSTQLFCQMRHRLLW